MIANTGDDIETLGVHVSPDPDLCTYWLTDQIDEERGWGIRDDAFTVFERLVELGAPDWFGLSDRDLATCLRAPAPARRRRPPDRRHLGPGARARRRRATVLPMCDEPVRTRVRTDAGWRDFQEYLIQDRAEPRDRGGRVRRASTRRARPRRSRAAVDAADVIVVGPSNPVISIGPILAVPGLREAIAGGRRPGRRGQPVRRRRGRQGPDRQVHARRSAASRRRPASPRAYAGVIDGLVVDAADPGRRSRGRGSGDRPLRHADGRTPTARRRVAEETLEFAATLRN